MSKPSRPTSFEYSRVVFLSTKATDSADQARNAGGHKRRRVIAISPHRGRRASGPIRDCRNRQDYRRPCRPIGRSFRHGQGLAPPCRASIRVPIRPACRRSCRGSCSLRLLRCRTGQARLALNVLWPFCSVAVCSPRPVLRPMLQVVWIYGQRQAPRETALQTTSTIAAPPMAAMMPAPSFGPYQPEACPR